VPTYQYSCTACGERTEMVQKFSDAPLTVCPACGGRLRKVFSPVGIVFKGSGFYRTDSRAANGAGAKDRKPEEAGATAAKEPGTGADRAGSNGSSGSGGAGSGEKKAAQTAGASASGGTGSSSGSSASAAPPGGKVA